MYYFLVIEFALIFLCVGSFCNVLIYRIPKNEQFIHGSSYCPKCKSKIKWYDNIPLLSYIILGGHCRKCGQPISIRYPIIEATVCVLATAVFGYNLYQIDLWEHPYLLLKPLIIGLVVCDYVALSVIDYKTMEVPVVLNYFVGICGIFVTILDGVKEIPTHIIGAFCVSVILFIAWWVTDGNGIGFGDVKLMFCIGLLTGWKQTVVGFLIGCLIALAVHPILAKITKGDNKLPFVPYLCMGSYISMFLGDLIMNLYISLISV